jgi:hypothetical protein
MYFIKGISSQTSTTVQGYRNKCVRFEFKSKVSVLRPKSQFAVKFSSDVGIGKVNDESGLIL